MIKDSFFDDSIVSMPFDHPLLEKLRKKKRNKYSFGHKGKREHLNVNAEAKVVRQCERLWVLRSVLWQAPVLSYLNLIQI